MECSSTLIGGGGTLNDQPFVVRGGLEPPTKGIHVLYPLTHQSSIPTELPHHKKAVAHSHKAVPESFGYVAGTTSPRVLSANP